MIPNLLFIPISRASIAQNILFQRNYSTQLKTLSLKHTRTIHPTPIPRFIYKFSSYRSQLPIVLSNLYELPTFSQFSKLTSPNEPKTSKIVQNYFRIRSRDFEKRDFDRRKKKEKKKEREKLRPRYSVYVTTGYCGILPETRR